MVCDKESKLCKCREATKWNGKWETKNGVWKTMVRFLKLCGIAFFVYCRNFCRTLQILAMCVW